MRAAKRHIPCLIRQWFSTQPPDTAPPVALLFLDIDGVLNSQQTREDGDHMPSAVLLDNLAEIVRTTGAQIVLSSTWRLETYSTHAVEHALGTRRLALLGSTADLTSRGDRVDEIFDWMSTHDEVVVKSWIAIDDMDLMKMNPKLDSDHFVRTDDASGLTREKVEEAVSKLYQQRVPH
mmetsp:Transcript_52428/g.120508  ORF Transcript_52428/g.120508 Transcript_52428/m.120508 type:complete len:178 (-) Transcript_52428:235-768(-)|eukprot:CAMPEP_0119398212 /NCGR_PEP_ID=MMETSP1334-20130426/140726_1 /TAXON_ID=127549 /ORGANISM="Calcidiscus leptoporus, Strain RCC1130" /LENGTH=177 /DNA_ID=CAMNT_0007422067 /DNA_START=730 /DNA_END=1263 /DNA_ORIENTATION=-